MDELFFSTNENRDIFADGEQFRGYVIKKCLGVGAAGAVFLAQHKVLDTMYAIKVMLGFDFSDGTEAIHRFVREAKIAARIQHPNLVRVHDAGYDDVKGIYYLVMDYVSGWTLRDKIAFGGPVPVLEAVDITRCVASVLAAGARMGLVHRDLKPENIMFSENGRVKLVDLGIAKVSDGDTMHTQTSAKFGTPAYVAPEQAMDASHVDSRADIYSLGVILFEMLSGRRPYAGDTPMAIIAQVISEDPIPDVKRLNPEVPNWASALIMRMCAKDPNKRIQSAEKLLDVINGYLHVEKEQADYSPLPEKAPFEIPISDDDVYEPSGRKGMSYTARIFIVVVATFAAIALIALIAFL